MFCASSVVLEVGRGIAMITPVPCLSLLKGPKYASTGWRLTVHHQSLTPPTRAATPRFQRPRPRCRCNGAPEALGQHDFLSWKGSSRTIAWMVRILLPHLLIYRKRKGKALDRLGNRGEATNGEIQEPERRSGIGRRL